MNRIRKKSWWHSPYLALFIYALVFAVINHVLFNSLDMIHDYTFHMGRIIGLAQSLQNGDLFPSLNFVFAQGVGYGSPMFYGNWLLYIPALVFLMTQSAVIAYTSLNFLIVFGLAASMYYAVSKIGLNTKKAFCMAIVSSMLFCQYGYGMTMVTMAVPLLIYCMYKVLYQDRNNPVLLGVVVALLVQTHILSTLVLAFVCALFVLCNLRKLTLKKIGSFILSIGIALLLSTGYLVQYMEQTNSQVFYFDWLTRDYPFAFENLLDARSLGELILTYQQPLILVALVPLLFGWARGRLHPLASQLLLISIVLFVLQSDVLPWHSYFIQTPLILLQDSIRIAFFIPILIVMACGLSWNLRWSRIFLLLQTVCFAAMYWVPTMTAENPYAALVKTDEHALATLEDAGKSWYDTSGDEYFTLDFIHADKKDPLLPDFQGLKNVRIENVERGYNNLEFDVELIDENKPGELIAGRIWYEGYEAEYSDGAAGSEPQLHTEPVSRARQRVEQSRGYPLRNERVHYDGKVYLTIEQSGHVRLFFEPTAVQIGGYIIEAVGWLMVVNACQTSRRMRAKTNYELHKKISRMRSDLFVQGENKEEKMSFDFVREEASAPELADASVHPFWKEKKNQEDSPSETEAFDEEEQIAEETETTDELPEENETKSESTDK